MTLDGADPHVLAEVECLRLLAGGHLGRVAITVKALPVILPVHFALDHDEIVFRAPPGGVLAEATRHAVIAFEADGSEPGYGYWSVLATGVARHLAERDARGRRDRRAGPSAPVGSAAERAGMNGGPA
jgi:nitroimidazol reductase NimA-like FMN-containing flavoprotein (pyridoxamine 5'-phosphate oxidase superfamily)